MKFSKWSRAAMVPALALLAVAATDSSFDAGRYLQHIRYLASPELKGRATGSPELEKAARYIEDQFRDAGLHPPPGAKGFRQPFQVTTSAKLGRANRVEISAGGETETLVVEKDFIPYNFSSASKASGSVVFAGYGITAPEYDYDDFANIDVRGKFVLILAHEPQEYDPKSVFDGQSYTSHAQPYTKAANARAHGARGVILVADRINHRLDAGTLERFGVAEGPSAAGIPFIEVNEEIVKPWFTAAGKDLESLETAIDADLKPRSFGLSRVQVRESIDIERAVKTVDNVVGWLPGSSDEYLVIGAHYDHLGLGGQFSMAPSLAGTVHPGADDNASGTAGVMELARHFASGPRQKRGLLFIAFAGEELGLLGSGFYVNHPELPLADAIAMINLDMIGRVRDSKLYVGGAGTSATLRDRLDRITPHHNLKADYSDNSGYGSSDHTSFTAKQVPVLFFFSGLHGDYHKPGDTWDKIDAAGSIEVLELTAEVAARLLDDPVRPQFARAEDSPYFGCVPDFSESSVGVRLADVREGSPAAQSGLRPGDVLFAFDGREIANLDDFTHTLRRHKAEDEVIVEVLRGTEKITAKVKLTEGK